MATPPGLEPDRIDALRSAAGDGPEAPPASSPPVAPRSAKAKAKRVIRGVVHRSLGWYVREAADAALAERAAQLHRLGGELERIMDQRDELAGLPVNFELLKGEVNGLHATTINLDLLKAEVREVKDTLESLGQAMAPGTGLAGAGARLAELREKVNAVERRLRREQQAPAAAPAPAAPSVPGPAARPTDSAQSELFDYVGFERRFRGDPEAVIAMLDERYGEVLAADPPVADLGCGRGELLEVLARRGVEVVGCDTDGGMVAEARARGIEVEQADALSFLRQRAEGSLGSIITTHVVEHLQLDYLIELLELAASRLRPGGVLIAETPNPASLIVLGNSYILDPTHVRPLHPSLLSFLCEGAGFRDIRLEFHSPAADYHLPLIDDPDAPPWAATVNTAFDKLNRTLFGPQEYAVLARTPPA